MNLLAIAAQLAEINQRLEQGDEIGQLVVVVPCEANAVEVEQATLQECGNRGVKLDAVEQVVVVKLQTADDKLKATAVILNERRCDEQDATQEG